jgi:hypothetical protein
MIEQSPKITEERKLLLAKIAQDPMSFLEKNRQRGKSCLEALKFLNQVRQEIRACKPDFVIKNPNPLFKQFYISGNSAVEHYIALFNLIKEAGYQQHELISAIMDIVPKTFSKDSKATKAEVARSYLEIANEAVAVVFKTQEN